ncbi:MAG: integrase core domain-containing protein [Actinomycetota bacterium]
MQVPIPSPITFEPPRAALRRHPRSGGSCRGAGSWCLSRTSAHDRRSCGSRLRCPTSVGRPTSRTGTYHPQTCGKVERFHQTLKRWLAKQRQVTKLEELQTQLDRFRDYYNEVRPHRSLGRRTPHEAYLARPKASPDGPVLPIEAHHRVRKDRVDAHGVVTLRYASRLHHIGLGRRYAGTRVLLLVADRNVTVITQDGEILRKLEFDPSRDYQPRSKP